MINFFRDKNSKNLVYARPGYERILNTFFFCNVKRINREQLEGLMLVNVEVSAIPFMEYVAIMRSLRPTASNLFKDYEITFCYIDYYLTPLDLSNCYVFYGILSWTILYELTRVVFTTTNEKHLLLFVEWLERVLAEIVENAGIIEKIIINDSRVISGEFVEIDEILINLAIGTNVIVVELNYDFSICSATAIIPQIENVDLDDIICYNLKKK